MAPSASGSEVDYAVKVDAALGVLGVLLEPATILAKAWDHIDRIGHRTRSWSPRTVLVDGGGRSVSWRR